MTTSENETSAPAVDERAAAWDEGRRLFDRMETYRHRGSTWDHHAADYAISLRRELETHLDAHGFHGTRIDPLGMTWVELQGAPWAVPPADCDRISCTCHGHVMTRREA